jgi:hypothetical protein
MITFNPFQLVDGSQLVNGSYFQGAFTTHVTINWNQTVAGSPRTDVVWESLTQSGPSQLAFTNQTSFGINTIPNTCYRFSVQDVIRSLAGPGVR